MPWLSPWKGLSCVSTLGTELQTTTKLDEIVSAVYRLLQRTGREWITWTMVANEVEGSVSLVDVIRGYAQLPEATDLFVTRGNNVRLSEQGLGRVARPAVPPTLPSLATQIAHAVKSYARRIRTQRFDVQGITMLTRTERHVLHAVHVELEEETIASDTPVTIYPADGGYPTRGRVMGQEADENVLYIAFESAVHSSSLPATLNVDRAFLLNQLGEAINGLQELPPLTQAILGAEDKGLWVARDDSAEVGQMLAALRTPWTRFLWGPPGAGKTYALGKLIKTLLEKHPDERILLLAPSNLAADGALMQFVSQIENSPLQHLLADHKVLRFGYPRRTDLLQRTELLGSKAQASLGRKIQRLAASLAESVRRGDREDAIAAERARLLELQNELRMEISEHVKQCAVVATTTTLAYMPSSPIHQTAWTDVLVDEVTMVAPALCVFLSSLATERFLLAGDPRQLGPVFSQRRYDTDEEVQWLGRDVYDVSGVAAGKGRDRVIQVKDRRLSRITSQRRCAPAIWENVSHLYEGVNIGVDMARVEPIAQLAPAPGQSTLLVDTSDNPDARCVLSGRSWSNPYSAQLAVHLAEQIGQQASQNGQPTSIAIIAPYRGQIKLLRRHLRERQSSQDNDIVQIDVGTIHQFQGSEADVVIFDVVDGVGRKGLGALLRDDTGMRLVNVAITRARGKLIVIADRTWCRESVARDENRLLWDLVMTQRGERRVMSLSLTSSV